MYNSKGYATMTQKATNAKMTTWQYFFLLKRKAIIEWYFLFLSHQFFWTHLEESPSDNSSKNADRRKNWFTNPFFVTISPIPNVYAIFLVQIRLYGNPLYKVKSAHMSGDEERWYGFSERDPMHCELNVTWKLFVENNNDE